MTPKSLVIVLSALTSMAYPQQPPAVEGTYRFKTMQSVQRLQEAANLIRTVASMPQVSIDSSPAAILFHGPADRVALADWILPALDGVSGDSAPRAYPLPDDEVAQVDFMDHVQSAQNIQELLTVLRTVAGIRRIFAVSGPPLLAMAGKQGDIAFASWILEQLNRPVPQSSGSAPRAFTVDESFPQAGTAARVNYLSNVQDPQGTQELMTVLRTVGEIQRIFNYTQLNALVLRGTDADIARAEWLIQSVDRPANQPSQGASVYTDPAGDDVTRIFYRPNSTPQTLFADLNALRSETKFRRAFFTSTPATLIVRGTADQVEAAAQLISARR